MDSAEKVDHFKVGAQLMTEKTAAPSHYTVEHLKRLREAHNEIADVQIELLRIAEKDKGGSVEWGELFQIRGRLNAWLYDREKKLGLK